MRMWQLSHATLWSDLCTALRVAWQFWQPVEAGTVELPVLAVYQCEVMVPVSAALLF